MGFFFHLAQKVSVFRFLKTVVLLHKAQKKCEKFFGKFSKISLQLLPNFEFIPLSPKESWSSGSAFRDSRNLLSSHHPPQFLLVRNSP